MDNRECYVDIADGIGNIIQSVPFIKAVKMKHPVLVGHDRPDFPEATGLVAHLFDRLVPRGTPIPHAARYCPIPNLSKFGSFPEHRTWFLAYHEPMPEEFDFHQVGRKYPPEHLRTSFDYVLWGGCKKAWLSKQWPYWKELSTKLCDAGHSVVCVGLPGEGDYDPRVVDARGIGLLETGGVLWRCGRFVGNEGGLSHYANAMLTDVSIIYGGTDPFKNFPPKREGLRMISLGMECQPCQFRSHVFEPARGCGSCPCLANLTVDMVFDRLLETAP